MAEPSVEHQRDYTTLEKLRSILPVAAATRKKFWAQNHTSPYPLSGVAVVGSVAEGADRRSSDIDIYPLATRDPQGEDHRLAGEIATRTKRFVEIQTTVRLDLGEKFQPYGPQDALDRSLLDPDDTAPISTAYKIILF